MKRALLYILPFTILVIFSFLSLYAHGQNGTKNDDLSTEISFNLIHLFIGTIFLVAGGVGAVFLWTNRLRKDIEDHTDKKIRELKDDLIKQIDKGEERIRFMERTALIKSLSDIEEVKRELLGTNKK